MPTAWAEHCAERSADTMLELRWQNGGDFANLYIDLDSLACRLELSSAGQTAVLDLTDTKAPLPGSTKARDIGVDTDSPR